MSNNQRVRWSVDHFVTLSFLGATKHLYNWLCQSVDWSVGWSVGRVKHSFDDSHVAPYWPTWPCSTSTGDICITGTAQILVVNLFITTPAHLHATWVAVYLALFTRSPTLGFPYLGYIFSCPLLISIQPEVINGKNKWQHCTRLATWPKWRYWKWNMVFRLNTSRLSSTTRIKKKAALLYDNLSY